MPYEVDVTIIGAGVVGLAVASQVSALTRQVFILEKNETFGQETSSRNSGVIHTSILSPKGSWNSKLCAEGNELMYELADRYGIGCRKTGKLLVAVSNDEVKALETLYRRKDEGIQMQMLSQLEMHKIEPDVRGTAALLLPMAGVIDAYGLMRCYVGQAREKGAQLVFKSKVTGIEKITGGYKIEIDELEAKSYLTSRTVINCAGLYSDKVAAMIGVDISKLGYKLHYFKGEYYSISSGKSRRINQRLIYPMLQSGGITGIHTVLDVCCQSAKWDTF